MNYKRQFSCGGILFRKDRGPIRVALISRMGGKIWCLPKGLVETGEKPEETALREVQEETGLTGKLLQKIGEIHYRYSSKEEKTLYDKRVWFFLMQHTGGSTKDHDFEVDAVRWFPINRAIEKLTYPSERQLMKKAWRLVVPKEKPE